MFLVDIGKDAFLYSFYHKTTSFREDYRKQHSKEPFANRLVKWRWERGSNVSRLDHEEAMRRMNIYRQWLLDVVLQMKTRSCYIIMQNEDVKPVYRDDPAPGFQIQPAWHQWWLASIIGAPELVIPVGEISYASRVSGNTERLPVAASIMGPPGSDFRLLAMAQRFLAE